MSTNNVENKERLISIAKFLTLFIVTIMLSFVAFAYNFTIPKVELENLRKANEKIVSENGELTDTEKKQRSFLNEVNNIFNDIDLMNDEQLTIDNLVEKSKLIANETADLKNTVNDTLYDNLYVHLSKTRDNSTTGKTEILKLNKSIDSLEVILSEKNRKITSLNERVSELISNFSILDQSKQNTMSELQDLQRTLEDLQQ